MSSRALLLVWLAVAVLVWNGIFDLYVSRGAREYLQAVAEAELGWGTPPVMAEVMSWTQERGALAATGWALLVFGTGCLTLYLRRAR